MENKCVPGKIKVLVTIVDRGKAEEITEMYRENGIMYNMILLGKGTAKSEILDYLGLGRTDKDIIISVAPEESVKPIIKILKEDMHLDKPGNGIAFTIPISSVDSAMSLEYICNLIGDRKEWKNGR